MTKMEKRMARKLPKFPQKKLLYEGFKRLGSSGHARTCLSLIRPVSRPSKGSAIYSDILFRCQLQEQTC